MENFVNDMSVPLLEVSRDNEEKQYFNEGLDEGSSSGYDSTDLDISDAESDWSTQSRDSDVSYSSSSSRGKTSKAGDTSERNAPTIRAHVKSTNALCGSLALILDMPELCDVTFLVGPEAVPVHGVRAIMGTRSKVLYQLILKHMGMRTIQPKRKSGKSKISIETSAHGDRLVIPVRKYDPEVFRMLVQFIHSGTATITDDVVSGLLCGADQFELRDLRKACWEYIMARVKRGHEGPILAGARLYAHHRMTQNIFDQIYAMVDNRQVAPGASPV